MGTGLGVYVPEYIYIIFLVGCLASLIRPSFGVYVLALVFPLHSGRGKLISMPFGSRMIELLMLFVIIGLLVGSDRIRLPKRFRNLSIALLAISYLSLWIGPALNAAVPFPIMLRDTPLGQWVYCMKVVLLMFLVYAAIQSKRQAGILLACMLVSFLWVSKNFYVNTSHRDMSHYSHNLRVGVGDDFGGSNGRAAYMAQNTLLLLGIFGAIGSLKVRILITAAIAIGIYSVLFSFSRGAWIGFALGGIYLLFVKFKWLIPILLLAAVFWKTLLPNAIIDRVTLSYSEGEVDEATESRLEVWNHSISTAMRDPVLGVGFACYPYYRGVDQLKDTHNMYLRAFVETGAVGTIILVLLWLSTFISAHRLFRVAENPLARAIGLGFASYMLCLIVANMFGDRWTHVELSGNTWIFMGLTALFLEHPEILAEAPVAAPETAPVQVPASVAPAGLPAFRYQS